MKKIILILSLLICSTFIYQQSIAQCHFDDWTALKALYDATDGDNWTDRTGWRDIINRQNEHPENCNLNELFGVETDTKSGRVVTLNLSSTKDYNFIPTPEKLSNTQTQQNSFEKFVEPNKLKGNNLYGIIPEEISMLSHLKTLVIVYDNLQNNEEGYSIPPSIFEMDVLTNVVIYGNELSGVIPALNEVTNLQIQENYFNCTILNEFSRQNSIEDFYYSPQYFTHSFEPFIVDTNAVTDIDIRFSNNLPVVFNPLVIPNFQWKKNGIDYKVTSGAELKLSNVQPSDAGAYTLHIYDDCMPEIEFISDPVYVIYPGYDLYGQPVEYNQIMVEFKDSVITKINKDEILDLNAGWVVDSCNCNRELYLWQFPTTVAATKALFEIDQKTKKVKNDDGEVDSGYNNKFTLSEATNFTPGFEVISNTPDNDSNDVVIYILDTGLDSINFSDNTFLYSTAPLDSCYTIPTAPAYNYLDSAKINNNYHDNVWHGTFGFDVITKGFSTDDNIKIIPLKIFNEAGQGNLFDFTCALYHAIDHNADIINVSAGYKGQKSTILERAINIARTNEVIICAAAGNDTINIDSIPQYPASFSSQHHYVYDTVTQELIDSIRYKNVISVGCLDAENNVSAFSNEGKKSVTLYANGEDIIGAGLNNEQLSASGTSMAAFLVTRELALEFAIDNTRDCETILEDFETNRLVSCDIESITNKRLNITLVPQDTINYFCPSQLHLSNQISASTYQANDKIYSDGKIDSNSGGAVLYKVSNEYIELQIGFEADGTIDFSAEIFDCNINSD